MSRAEQKNMLGVMVCKPGKLRTISLGMFIESAKRSNVSDAVSDVLLLKSNDILGTDAVSHRPSDPVPIIGKCAVPRSIAVVDNTDGSKITRADSQPFYLPKNGNSCFM
jgi:hypothetical protein